MLLPRWSILLRLDLPQMLTTPNHPPAPLASISDREPIALPPSSEVHMVQPQEHQRVVRSLEARIDEQIEEVARVICEDRNAEKEIMLLTKLTSLLTSLKVVSKAAAVGD